MLTGEERGGERAREKGPDWRGRGGYSHGEGGREEDKRKTGVRKYRSKLKRLKRKKIIIIKKEKKKTHSDKLTHNFSKREEA